MLDQAGVGNLTTQPPSEILFGVYLFGGGGDGEGDLGRHSVVGYHSFPSGKPFKRKARRDLTMRVAPV